MGNALTTLKGQLTEKTTNLKHWKEFFEALDVDGNSNWIETAPLLLERFWTWKEEWGDLEEYWETFYQQLTEKKEDKNNEFKNAFLPFIKKKKEFDNLKSKIKDLENSLLALAKQKLKGKKEAKQLLTQLESNWKAKEQTWTKSEQDYLKNIQELKEELATSLQLHQTKIKDLETQLTSLSRQKITTQQQLTQTQTHYELRKKQATIVGIISLVLILYLAWPLTNKEKEAPRTWTYV